MEMTQRIVSTIRGLPVGPRILVVSAGLGLVGVSPLLLYIALGPADGNPVGLGLLAVASVLIGAAGFVLGLLTTVVQYIARLATRASSS